MKIVGLKENTNQRDVVQKIPTKGALKRKCGTMNTDHREILKGLN